MRPDYYSMAQKIHPTLYVSQGPLINPLGSLEKYRKLKPQITLAKFAMKYLWTKLHNTFLKYFILFCFSYK